ncbi:multiheme c-type cytochrome [Acidobacterium sp. S8]|uniref:multiheme c-type cytochrome n=1 Tax=Acidobacterium sp. S8 TaxID=1641854 RepID=UPI00131C2D39|nr:multiheme c-type cytochrome [Acidobacterium sp. S8]
MTVIEPCARLAFGFGNLWIPSCGEHMVVRVDAQTGRPQAKIAASPADDEGGIAVSAGSVWIVTSKVVLLVWPQPLFLSIYTRYKVTGAGSGWQHGDTAMKLPVLTLSALCLSGCLLYPRAFATGQVLSTNAPQQSGAATKSSGEARSPLYAGDGSCLSCHREQSMSYVHTAHHLTSQLPSSTSILGSFSAGANELEIAEAAPVIGDPGVAYKMESRDGGYFVTAVTGFPGQLETRSERIDIVVGSGVRGQSYLYWRGDELYELPISYWSDGKQWINSPGYRNGPPNFDRAAVPRCLECHLTYIEPLSADPETRSYDKASLVTGISCETCHGPGAAHVALHRNGAPAVSSGEAILNPARFSRDRQIDMCALCHSGAQQVEITPAFSYVPGESLGKYLGPNPLDGDLYPDVHANQVGLLKRSRCFLSSAKMTCSTCHDVHAEERPAASYSARCLTCHRVESCGMEKKIGHAIAENCIDCHMPVEQTNAIVSETADKVIRTRMRTHWIKVYPAAASVDQP